MPKFDKFDDLIGVPFKRNGRDMSGMDCWGLCMEAKKRADGTILPEYCVPDDPDSIVNMILKDIDFAERIDSPEPYCLVGIALVAKEVDHIGLVLEDCVHFIHSLSVLSMCRIERLNSFYWRNKIRGYYRWKGKK